jgi:type II secretory pathway component PulC
MPMSIAQLKNQLASSGSQRWLAWLCLLLLLVVLLLLIWRNTQILLVSSDQSVKVATARQAYNEPSADVIPGFHLFGSSATDLGDLPLASLGLQVKGIFMNNQANQSRALIGMTGQAPQMYNVGDVLPGSVKIYKITQGSVIVSHNNRLEKLPFALQGINFNQAVNHQGLFN